MDVMDNCLLGMPGRNCRYGNFHCAGCAWDREEDARRRALPLRRDKKTGLLRKFVGRRKKKPSDESENPQPIS